MKRALLLLCLLTTAAFAAAKDSVQIDRIEPTCWFTGMKQTELQLMVYGPNIGHASVSLQTYRGVTLQRVLPLDSPNYLLVYLQVGQEAKPGLLRFSFSQDGKRTNISYELRSREKPGAERVGFDASDVLYMLMPDRFACGEGVAHPVPGLRPYTIDRTKPSGRHGGDLRGLRQHLDYFEQLGVTALWLTPVLENNCGRGGSYHGYATTNYYRVDPRFGTNEEYRLLADELHQRGMKLVMDMIFNHSSSEHPWCTDRPTKDWYNEPADGRYMQTNYKLSTVLDPYSSQRDFSQTVDGWFVRSMPDLNQRNPHVLRYLIQNSKWWIETVGIDGIRMDTYPYADRQAMSLWMKELLEEYPRFNVVGETWVNEPAYTAAWQKGSPNAVIDSHLPTVMDFSFWEKVNAAAHEDTERGAGLNRIYNSFVYDYLYPDPLHVMAFLDNHDTDRFLREGKDVAALKQALTLLLTTRRIPQIYYGTEVLMNGVKRITDGYVRCDFPGGWRGDEHDCFTAEGRTAEENDMFHFVSKILHWRKTSAAIARGSMTHFSPFKGCYVYAREYEGQRVLVFLNGTDRPQTLPLSYYAEVLPDRPEAQDVVTGRIVPLQGDLQLAPRESLILDSPPALPASPLTPLQEARGTLGGGRYKR